MSGKTIGSSLNYLRNDFTQKTYFNFILIKFYFKSFRPFRRNHDNRYTRVLMYANSNTFCCYNSENVIERDREDVKRVFS